jgi:hypothetical protein
MSGKTWPEWRAEILAEHRKGDCRLCAALDEKVRVAVVLSNGPKVLHIADSESSE